MSLHDRTASLEALGAYLRNELSAVDVYALALKSFTDLELPAMLEGCRRSHLERAELLRAHLTALGGRAPEGEGSWGVVAPAVENALQQVGIAALEELEYQDLKRYRDEVAKLDEETRSLMRTRLLPAQERTYRVIRSIRFGLG